MSKPEPNHADAPQSDREEPEYDPHLVRLRDRLAGDGITLQIPRQGAKLNLPDPIAVDGETASEIIIRWRHAE